MIQAYVNQDNIFAGNWEEGYAQPNCTAVSEPYYGDFKIPTWNGSEFVEAMNEADILAEKQAKAIQIDLHYTNEIGKLLVKHQNKFMEAFALGGSYVIPRITLDEVQALKNECKAKIAELGITDYSYRQNIPILAKGEMRL